MMWGAIAGDIIGSRFEFDRPNWRRDFELFTDESYFTDDTVMTIAVAEALKVTPKDAGEREYRANFTQKLREYGRRYPNAGYGTRFITWLQSKSPRPYYSYGNGSAMRVSPVGWAFDTLKQTQDVAKYSAEITHNHPEGIRGAVCTASIIWKARNGATKADIADTAYSFWYTWESVDEYIKHHKHDESCMDTMPKAISAFMEGNNFEEVVRNAVAMGGDTDTIAAVAGAMAEAMYGVPQDIIAECKKRIDKRFLEVVE